MGDVGRWFSFAIARPRDEDSQIPVYDEPDGPPRTLADVNAIDGLVQPNPLFPTTWVGNLLVLPLVEDAGDWLLVQVPTRPNQSHIWVEADHFELRSTNVWVEVSLASSGRNDAGRLWVYRSSEQIFESAIVSGRPERPTPRVTGWVEEFYAGSEVGPAYGSWIVGFGAFSEALGSYGLNGGIPSFGSHGTNQPELIGQRVSSGNIRMPNEAMDRFVAIDGLVGAPVHVHEGAQLGAEWTGPFRITEPATTTLWDVRAPRALQAAP